MANTIMTGTGNTNEALNNVTKYALFMGGTNTTNEVLRAYDPLTTGFEFQEQTNFTTSPNSKEYARFLAHA